MIWPFWLQLQSQRSDMKNHDNQIWIFQFFGKKKSESLQVKKIIWAPSAVCSVQKKVVIWKLHILQYMLLSWLLKLKLNLWLGFFFFGFFLRPTLCKKRHTHEPADTSQHKYIINMPSFCLPFTHPQTFSLLSFARTNLSFPARTPAMLKEWKAVCGVFSKCVYSS